MGVHGLWDLLAPVGRRVSVETLAGKKLAIDASIWMIQFMKAMRDEKGEMVRNAHLLGFFRRICKLLYLRTKPVFVFDGGTPALKRRTVIARRRQRENAQAKVRKTAEKLLLNHLKAMRLKELANDLVDQRKNEKINNDKGKKIQSDEACMDGSNPEQDVNLVFSNHQEYEKLDEMLAASIAAEEGLGLVNNASNSAAAVQVEVEVNSAKDEEMMLEPDKRKKLSTGKEVLLDQTDVEISNLETIDMREESYYQEKLDEMLAASIAASGGGSLTKNGSISGSVIHCEDDGQDEEEEMILPHGKVDPSVLASLPPSMQLDLLVQMREKLMAENREKYQEVKKVPEKFSELQIQAYLKTVAFRREIDQVQKSAAGKDVGGVHASRIASEANREFIFSSTFTGDKELLASAGVKRDGDRHKKTQVETPTDGIDTVAANGRSGSVTGLVTDRSNDHVETYLDVSGRVRVSRVRAMGMRMTRDLERNLELMKEIELGRTRAANTENSQSAFSRIESDATKSFPSDNSHSRISHGNSSDRLNNNSMSRQFPLNSEEPIQVSFEIDPEKKCFDSDDDLFTNLVAGNPVPFSSPDNGASQRQSSGSASDDDWEDGTVERNVNDISHDLELRTETPAHDSNINDESEVEWEEGVSDIHENSSSPSEVVKTASRGQLEEEAALQEAIRRSLEDLGNEKFDRAPFEHEKLKVFKGNAFPDVGTVDQEFFDGPSMSERDGFQQKETLEIEKLNTGHQNNILQASSSSGRQLKLSQNYGDSNSVKLSQDINEEGNLSRQLSPTELTTAIEAKGTHMNLEESSDISVDGTLSASSKMCPGNVTRDEIREMEAATSDLTCSIMVNNERKEMEEEPSIIANAENEPSCDSIFRTNQSVPLIELSANKTINGGDLLQKSGGGRTCDDYLNGEKFKRDLPAPMDDDNMQDLTEASLEKEILITNQECINLGNEQRKLERNAESVSIEMFAECQELLQMFGLPYIIAPMEAEAQCAYMELANLVDGVVTDDSDVFLFGARNVYKNIFDDRKYVETYFMKDIEKDLGLSREKLIRMALLLGSDYTEGISGIGIVNAVEVMNAFPEENGLHEFREWIESPDPNILGKLHLRTGLNERKKGSKIGDSDTNNPGSDVEGSFLSSQNNRQAYEENQADYNQEIKRTFMNKHRNVSKNWHIPSSFPSEAVISAYLCPQVDKSTEPFKWGKPDLLVLHRLCWEKFGWDIKKSDELLLPVLKEYDKHETQLRLEAFYTFNERFAKIRSKRIKKAVKDITGKQSLDLMDDPVEEVSKRKQKRTSGIPGDNETEIPSKRTVEIAPEKKNNSLQNSNSNKSARKRVTAKAVMPELENPEHQWQKNRQRSRKQSHGSERGKRPVISRGRNRNLGFRQDDSTSDDGNSREDELGVGVEKSGGPLEVRRSKRTRRPVNYAVEDVEIDDAKTSAEQCDEKESDKVVDPGLTRTQETSEDAANGVEQETMEYPPVTEEFSGDYLEKGGGFCIDEAEDGQLEVNQSNDAFETQASQDYLKTGGGFYVDDKEAGEDQNTGSISPATAGQETAKSPCFSTVAEDASSDIYTLNSVSSVGRTSDEFPGVSKANALGTDTEPNMRGADAASAGDHSSASVYQPQSSVNNTGAPGVDGLSGMPFLKRKRRRN